MWKRLETLVSGSCTRRDEASRICILPSAFLSLSFALLLIPLDWICGWLLAVTVHELGHYIALKFLGLSVRKITVRGSGVFMDVDAMSTVQELMTAAAGPLMSILLLAFSRVAPRTAVCAFFQALFNLLPLYPMDGGRIMRSALILASKIKNSLQRGRTNSTISEIVPKAKERVLHYDRFTSEDPAECTKACTVYRR